MKNVMIVLALVCAVLTQLPAQYGFRFGVQASPMFTWLDTDDRFINANGQNLGFRIGTKIDYFFADKYAFTTGLNLGLNQGGRLLHDFGGDLLKKSELGPPYNSLPDGSNIRYHINYIDVPFGLHLLTNEIFRDFRFFFEIPVFNFAFLYNAKGDIVGPGLTTLEGETINKDLIPIAISWGLGGGVEYNLRGNSSGDTNLIGGIFYNQGFTDITKDSGIKFVDDGNGNKVPQDEDSKALLRGITLMLGIMF